MRCDRKRFVRLLALFGLLAAAMRPAIGQEYPVRPIRLVVPYLAGGATDVGARVVAERVAQELGQPIVIENKPGAGVVVGTNSVAKAEPDGYTLLITTLAHAINQSLYKSLPYDSIADFTPVALMGIINFALVVHPSVDAKDLPSLVQYLRANPDKANYGSAGIGSPMHLGPELFKSLASAEARHVPYRGEVAALNDLIAGRLTFMLSATATVTPFIESGAARAIAVPSPERSQLVPSVPTTAELGMPEFQTYSCLLLLAPKGTPRALVEKLNRAVNAALSTDDVSAKLVKLGIERKVNSTPESTVEFIRQEAAKWAPIVKATGATMD